MTSLLKTLNKNSNNTQPTKFNPDVPNLYNQVNQVRNTSKYVPTNEGYKTIINEKMPSVVKKAEDLKINYEKTNEQDTKLAIKKMQELNNERQQEVERLNKQIDHTKKLDELIKIKRKESTVDYQAASHGDLKQLRIAQNDKIKKEKEKYNNIIDSLNKIF